MASKAFIEQAYLAYFGRPADPGGLLYYSNSALTEDQLLKDFYLSPESQALYGNATPLQQINMIYNMLFGRDAEPAGLNYWASQILEGKVLPSKAAYAILLGAVGPDDIAVDNKLAASNGFTAGLDTTTEILNYSTNQAFAVARTWLDSVTGTPATQAQIDTAIAASVAIGGVTGGATYALTTDIDLLNGTPGNDFFIGIDNDSPSTTVTLGDTINGRGGDDTLKIFSETDFLSLSKLTVTNVERLVVTNSLSDWDDMDAGNFGFDTIDINVGGQESGGLDVYNIRSTSAVTLTNIVADDESNYITFNTDNTSTVGNTIVTVSNVDMSNYEEYFEVESTFTNADTVNVTTNLNNISDQKQDYYGEYYQYLYTGTKTGVNVNATFNVTNVSSADEFYVELDVYQAGGSVNNLTVNVTNSDNVDIWLDPDDDGKGTSKTDVATFNLSGVKNTNGQTYIYTNDVETLNVNVLAKSDVEAIGNYYNEDGSLMGNTVVNLNAAADLKVGFWDLNDDGGVTENTTFNIVGAGNVTIVDLDDGSSNVTINGSTATGNISIKSLESEVVSVTTGAGNDTLQLGGYTTVVATGAGNDTVDTNGYDYGNADAKTIDGGTGTNTIGLNDGLLLNAASAAKISNFQVLSVTGATGVDVYDMSVESSLNAVVGTGNLGDVTIAKAAAGTTVALTSAASSDSTVTALTYALKTATGTSDNFSLSLNANDTEVKANDKDGQLTVSAVTANAIESFSISSNATTTDGLDVAPFTLFTAKDYKNTITSLTGDAVKTMTLTGAAGLTITDVQAAALTKVDASAMTGKMTITLDASANAAAMAVLGGSAGDSINMVGNLAIDNIVVGNGGADAITLAALGTKETIRYAADSDSVLTLVDTTVPVVTPVVYDVAKGYDTVVNFTTGEDKIELSSALGLATGDARSAITGKGTIAPVATNAELAASLQTLIGSGAGFFNDGATNRAVATAESTAGTYVFIDVNADGNFTNGVDNMIQLTGTTSISISDIVFG